LKKLNTVFNHVAGARLGIFPALKQSEAKIQIFIGVTNEKCLREADCPDEVADRASQKKWIHE
jgi:hypothetical protein